MLNYHLQIRDSRSQIISIMMEIENIEHNNVIQIPKFMPGSYMLRNFIGDLQNIKAIVDNKPLKLDQIDTHSWSFAKVNKKKKIWIIANFFTGDLQVRGCYLNQYFGFFNPICIAPQLKGFSGSVSLTLHNLLEQNNWKIYCGAYKATWSQKINFNDYHHLCDNPILMGAELQITQDNINKVDYNFIFTHNIQLDHYWLQKFLDDTSKLLTTSHNIFNNKVPCKAYSFFILPSTDKIISGLEHRNCSALQIRYQDLKDDYEEFLSLLVHEHFHIWNVLGIMPKQMLTPNLNSTVQFSDLWFFEGITVYYEQKILLKSGLIDKIKFWKNINSWLEIINQNFGYWLTDVLHASKNAWTGLYIPNNNSVNQINNYYIYGAIIGLYIDTILEQHTQISLDNIMSELWQKTIKNQLLCPDGFILEFICKHLPKQYSIELKNYLEFPGPIETKSLLPEISNIKSENNNQSIIKKFGINLNNKSTIIKHVHKGSNAWKIGLLPNDYIIEIDKHPVTYNNFSIYLLNATSFSIIRYGRRLIFKNIIMN